MLQDWDGQVQLALREPQRTPPGTAVSPGEPLSARKGPGLILDSMDQETKAEPAAGTPAFGHPSRLWSLAKLVKS